MSRHPAIPYVAPFAVFLVLLSVGPALDLGALEHPFRVTLLSALLFLVSRRVIDLRAPHALASVAVGIGVFAVWIAPDVLWPGYREHWLFQNAILGRLSSSIPEELRANPLVLGFRTIRAVILVPIVEELFWRAWLMRWLIQPDFLKIPLGTYGARAFWISALLFASEHGPYWEVGLVAGVIYNWWMIRTKSLGDCILAHAVTNGCLCAYVILADKWEYWM